MARYIDISDLHIPKGIFEGINTPKLLTWLESITPADVEEVRHGEWLCGNKWQPCSRCHRRGKKSWSFCPYCGAKMDGKENRNE